MKYKEKGNSVVETILVLPLLVAVVLGTIQAAEIYRAYNVVKYSAVAAARSAMVYPPKPPSDPVEGLNQLLGMVSDNPTNWAKVVMTAKVASIPAAPAGNSIVSALNDYTSVLTSGDFNSFLTVVEQTDAGSFGATFLSRTLYSMLAAWPMFELCKGEGDSLKCEPVDENYQPKAGDRLRVTVYYIYDLRIPFIRRVFAEIYYRQVLSDLKNGLEEAFKEGTGFENIEEGFSDAVYALRTIVSFLDWLNGLGVQIPGVDIVGLQKKLSELLVLLNGQGQPPPEEDDLLFTLDDLIDPAFDGLMLLFEFADFYPIVLQASAGTVIMPKAHFEGEG